MLLYTDIGFRSKDLKFINNIENWKKTLIMSLPTNFLKVD